MDSYTQKDLDDLDLDATNVRALIDKESGTIYLDLGIKTADGEPAFVQVVTDGPVGYHGQATIEGYATPLDLNARGIPMTLIGRVFGDTEPLSDSGLFAASFG